MFCSNCGIEIKNNMGFCPQCGSPVVSVQTESVIDTKSTKSRKRKLWIIIIILCLISAGCIGILIFAIKNNNSFFSVNQDKKEKLPSVNNNVKDYKLPENGSVIFSTKYNVLDYIAGRFIVENEEKKQGVLDMDGNVIIPISYDRIDHFNYPMTFDDYDSVVFQASTVVKEIYSDDPDSRAFDGDGNEIPEREWESEVFNYAGEKLFDTEALPLSLVNYRDESDFWILSQKSDDEGYQVHDKEGNLIAEIPYIEDGYVSYVFSDNRMLVRYIDADDEIQDFNGNRIMSFPQKVYEFSWVFNTKKDVFAFLTYADSVENMEVYEIDSEGKLTKGEKDDYSFFPEKGDPLDPKIIMSMIRLRVKGEENLSNPRCYVPIDLGGVEGLGDPVLNCYGKTLIPGKFINTSYNEEDKMEITFNGDTKLTDENFFSNGCTDAVIVTKNGSLNDVYYFYVER